MQNKRTISMKKVKDFIDVENNDIIERKKKVKKYIFLI